MHVIMLSTDRTIFDTGSPARQRMEEYADAIGKLSVIVFCRRAPKHAPVIGATLSLYPTNSSLRLTYIRDAVSIAKKIGRADVVTAQDPFETGLAGKRISRLLHIQLHVQVHTNFFATGFTGKHWPLNLIRKMIAKKILRHASRIRAVSESIKDAIEKKYHPKAAISVLPIFVDTEKLKRIVHTAHPRFKVALLAVSRLEKEKRIDEAIRALAKARTAGIDAGLDIVGAGREENNLKRLAKSLGIQERVEFHGFQRNLEPYYASATALLYPGASYEGYGMGIIEALAARVPVLAKDVGIARQSGAEIAEGDFGDAVVAFLKKPAREARLLYEPYASKEEYLKKFVEDLKLTIHA